MHQRQVSATPVRIIPLRCIRCQTPVGSGPDEVAWRCTECGQGLYLDPQAGLVDQKIRFVQPKGPAPHNWLPFWVARGRVVITYRETYSTPGKPNPVWEERPRFFLPAFELDLPDAVGLAQRYLLQPPSLQPAPPQPMPRVTVDRADARALAEFLVLSIEAQGRDALKALEFDLRFEPWELWIIAHDSSDLPARQEGR